MNRISFPFLSAPDPKTATSTPSPSTSTAPMTHHDLCMVLPLTRWKSPLSARQPQRQKYRCKSLLFYSWSVQVESYHSSTSLRDLRIQELSHFLKRIWTENTKDLNFRYNLMHCDYSSGKVTYLSPVPQRVPPCPNGTQRDDRYLFKVFWVLLFF